MGARTMILRRLSQHVKDQNWFAVALDFVIVVSGILIAFQITSWNEARKDHRAELRYLAELAVNLEADVAQAQEGQEVSLRRLALAEAVLRPIVPDLERLFLFIEIEGALPPFGGLEAVPYAGLTSTFYMVSADSTFQELVQTGNIGVLSNRALVKDLTAYYSRVDRQRGDDGILLNQVDPMLGYLRDNGRGMADRATIEEVTALAASDPALLGFVKMAGFLGHWQYSRLVQIELEAEAMLTAVQAEIEDKR